MNGFLVLLPVLLPVVLLFVGGFACVVACATPRTTIDSTPVSTFDLPRYMGTWYEIARYENTFERGVERVRAHYTLLSTGRVEVVNSGVEIATGRYREAIGKAKTTDRRGLLRVSFFWIFYSDYTVLALDHHYHWALVGSRSPRYLWILARTPTLPAEQLAQILHIARTKGYPTEKLYYPQPYATEQGIPNASTRAAMEVSSSRETFLRVGQGVSRSKE